MAHLPSPFTVKVVGVTFIDHYPDNMWRLREVADLAYLNAAGDIFSYPVEDSTPMEPFPALLVRNPNNEHDSNAIEVHVPALGELAWIGHVPAAMAARLAPLLDSGEEWKASVVSVLIDQDHPDRPGISIKIERVLAGEPF